MQPGMFVLGLTLSCTVIRLLIMVVLEVMG
jgi:hypothetical protein